MLLAIRLTYCGASRICRVHVSEREQLAYVRVVRTSGLNVHSDSSLSCCLARCSAIA
jgi:hypothetical protein